MCQKLSIRSAETHDHYDKMTFRPQRVYQEILYFDLPKYVLSM